MPLEENTQALEQLTRAVQDLAKSTRGGGGPRAGSARDGGAQRRGLLSKQGSIGGGAAGGLAGLAGRAGLGALLNPATAALAATAAIAAPIIGGGLINAQRGGDFGAGASAAGIDLLGKIPFLGELTGASAISRVQGNAKAQLNALTNPIAALGGFNTPESARLKDFFADRFQEQAIRIEKNEQDTSVRLNAKLGRTQAAIGGVAGGESVLTEIRDLLRAVLGKGSPGGMF